MQQFDDVKSVLAESQTYYLVSVDMNSNYSYLNRRYALWFEPIHGDLVGKNFSITMHPDDQLVCEQVSMQAFANPDSVFPAVLRKMDGNGGFVMTKWEFKAMFDELGNPNGIFCIGHDITELTRANTDLEEIRNSHSHEVRKHVANLLGLGRVIAESDNAKALKHVAKMIEQCTIDLDNAIRKIY
ncbi:PAS domain-containing protein [Pedobacter namyangjuensis]|uniref:PAS domain-containing protein n=1 Tax=Pedobacter namyangjuensis TaxID=600626 RepID=UPI000DE41281|nr:PAS domain-containing protein [Pedobacter namyangjuensis]